MTGNRNARYCAWCDHELAPQEGAARPDRAVIPPLCSACSELMVFQMGVPLQTFIDSLPAPIFVVNDDSVVQAANRLGLLLLNKGSGQVLKRSGGLVFDCAYAQLPEGCGRTVHCSGCAIRRSVRHTFETGEPLTGVPASLRSAAPGEQQTIDMRISTEKMGAVVILRIDRPGPAPACC